MTLLFKGERITVETNTTGAPQTFTWQGQTHAVEKIVNQWSNDEEWWKSRVWRNYFKLTTTTGLLVEVYCDLPKKEWYLQRLYD